MSHPRSGRVRTEQSSNGLKQDDHIIFIAFSLTTDFYGDKNSKDLEDLQRRLF